jgi:hypothetical protein
MYPLDMINIGAIVEMKMSAMHEINIKIASDWNMNRCLIRVVDEMKLLVAEMFPYAAMNPTQVPRTTAKVTTARFSVTNIITSCL